jgi:hypothetical protein
MAYSAFQNGTGGGGGGVGTFNNGFGSAPTFAPGSGMLQNPGGGGTGSGALSGMQMGTSAVSMLTSIAAGNNRAAAYNSAAGDARIEGQGAEIQGHGQVAGLRTQLTQTLGARTVQAGAGGVDVGQGAPAAQRATLSQRVGTQSAVDLAGSNINATKYQINSLNDNLMAQQAKLQGQAGAIGAGAGLGLSLLMMG